MREGTCHVSYGGAVSDAEGAMGARAGKKFYFSPRPMMSHGEQVKGCDLVRFTIS